MKHQTSIKLHDYWRSCHVVGGVAATQIQAEELAPLLPSLFLIDLDGRAGMRVQYCGASLARRYGRDLVGEGFLDLWTSEDRKLLERHLRVVSMRSAGLVAGFVAETVGAGFTSFEMVLLPLAGEAGAAGAIGSIERIGGHEEMNRIRSRLVSQSIRSVRFLPAPTPASSPFSLLGFLPAAEVPTAARRRRHLSLVVGGKDRVRSAGRPSLTET
jgi:hypothetical protein